jgi:UDP-N-acetylmuramate dehydrogenase
MNGGAYGREMVDVVAYAEAIDRTGRRHRVTRQELGLGYRSCAVPEDWIFVSATLEGGLEARTAIARRIDEIQRARADSQPIRARTGGSTFANPPGDKAWRLIDAAGCRGLMVGGAQVSEKHCNFLVNLGTATADDLERLGEEVRRRVLHTSGVRLEWEIRRIGVPQGPAPRPGAGGKP